MSASATQARHALQTRSSCGKLPLISAAEEVDLAKQIEAGLYAQRLLESSSATAATNELREIAAQGDLAYERMIRSNLGLVPFVARGYLGQGLDMEELVQEGIVGLVIAVQKYDFTRGIKFSSHAVWWIRYALTTGTANGGRAIRVPREVHAEINRFRRLRSELAVEGKPNSVGDMAQVLGLTENKAAEIEKLSRPIRSLEAIGLDGQLSDRIEYRTEMNSPSALDVYLKRECGRRLAQAFSALDGVEMRYLELLYGVDTGRPRSKHWVQKEMGLRPEQAAVIYKKVVQVMHTARTSDLEASI